MQCTGEDGSLAHPIDVTDKPLHSQHLEGDGWDEVQDVQHAKDTAAKTINAKDITAKDNNNENGTKTKSWEEAKEDEEAYEEVTSTFRGLLNKYREGKNRYQNLHRMMDSRTSIINHQSIYFTSSIISDL